METRWDCEFDLEHFPEIFEGMLVTVFATLVGIVIALTLGLVLALGRRAKSRWISYPFAWFIEFVRSTPLLIQLYFLYYVLPEYGLTLSPLVIGILALGLHYSCYTAEVYRAAGALMAESGKLKGVADEGSLVEAVKLAIDLASSA